MKTIIVTGASQGIGAEIAKKFSSLNNTIVILIARSEEKLQRISEECKALGAEAHYFICDVTNEDAVKHVAKKILAKWSPDVLVNNAGLYQPTSFAETTAEEFNFQININLTSAFLITQAFLPSMLAKKSGDIFFVCSTASWQPFPVSPAYCAAKHGLLGLARTLRDATKHQGLRVIAVMPGKTLTPAWDGADIDTNKFIPAEDIANVIVNIYHLDRRTNIDEIIVRPRVSS